MMWSVPMLPIYVTSEVATFIGVITHMKIMQLNLQSNNNNNVIFFEDKKYHICQKHCQKC